MNVKTTDAIPVEKFFADHQSLLQLHLLAGEMGTKRLIKEPTINRPGLALAGFTKYFANKRVQVIGSAEDSYMKSLPLKERDKRYAVLIANRIPCLVYCRGINPDPLMLHQANRSSLPVFKSPFITRKFINLATIALDNMFAPHSTEMGSMVDILGVGVVIRGESGIGKSECVLDLIERGYSLVSDDITQVTQVDGVEIIGTSPDVTRNLMEVRGIGIIDVNAMFGVKSIRTRKRVDLVVTLRTWNDTSDVDRLGLEEDKYHIMDVDIPHITIPVRPGRNLARLVEVAAMQTKLRVIGHNAARSLDERLITMMTKI